ncbi:DUF421 domain-containing protein [Brevibacillus sp. SYSU BS000544]|uniref:DUF421 domain-containing protein n=1 Tax=Brevibacillus sp. SYSU BS000544 TaxID=3416443 RepID=UPI003CE50D2D
MSESLNILIRSFLAFVILFAMAKIFGKRQISQLTYIEYIVGITIGSIAAFMATDMDGPIYHSLISLAIFSALPILLEFLSLKSKHIRDFVDGKSTVLIKDGKVLEDNLKKERLTSEDFLEHLRMKNVFKVADVEFAVMETNGDVSVLLKADQQPLTPKLLNMQVSPAEAPQAVIMDGAIMDESLSNLGLNRGWLKVELAKAGVALENVFLGQVDKGGQLYLDLFDDKLMVPEPTMMPLTYATLKKCQADLELYALATKSEAMKQSYTEYAKRIQHVMDQVNPLLNR